MRPRPFRPLSLLFLFASLTLFSISPACGVSANESPPPAAEPVYSETAVPTQSIPFPPTAIFSYAPTPHIDRPPDDVLPTVLPPRPAIPEFRRLTLEFPPQIRVGDSDVIRLSLELDEFGKLTPTAEITGHEVTDVMVEIPDLYETHNIIAEGRLDLAGMQVRPSEVVSEPMLPGQSVTFYWSIRPPEMGMYRGTAWLHLRFVDKSNGAESRKPVSAQIVEIEAVNFFGLSANFARTGGALGSIVGGVLGFPFLEGSLKFLFRRRRK